ncbi:MAG TPA: glycoside hydrolase family 97 N-terminal domain-containing protein, partial [Flavisolibacter sp.]|nr:glycoside hydrolase family 97 N-terminal domain-containing protein [Flavisolibacter sp.]
MKKILIAPLLLMCLWLQAQKKKSFELSSPDGSTILHVQTTAKTTWWVTNKGENIIEPSSISLQLKDGPVLGDNAIITSSPQQHIATTITPVNYFKSTIKDEYNQLTLNCKGDYGIIFRVYNDAVAYRFFTKKKGDIIISNEEANFNFPEDENAFIPIQWDYRDGKSFNSSFEALYHEIKLSQFPKDSLAFLPILVNGGSQKKVAILEADLEDYPGMYLDLNATQKGLKGVFAPLPTEAQVVHINYIPTHREDFIARTNGTRNFPWRVVVISQQDKDLLNQDIVQKLASPSR